MNNFKTLQRGHEQLLRIQQSGTDISEEVKDYVKEVKISSSEIYRNAERDQLRSNLRYWASYLYEKTGMFPQLDLLPLSGKAIAKQKWAAWLSFGMIFFIVVVFILVFSLYPPSFFETLWNPTIQVPTATLSSNSSILRYGFDKDTMGWVPRTRFGDQAIIDVQQKIKFGQSSLELQIELIGQDERKSKGEVFVDLSSNPPIGVVAPLDLMGNPITMLIYIPSTAIGDQNSPNGIQIFVTDIDGRSQYGVWNNLTTDNTDKWTVVTLAPSFKTSQVEDQNGASTNEGFDPTNINIIGLKFGAGSAFDKTLTGSIWIDGVSWQ